MHASSAWSAPEAGPNSVIAAGRFAIPLDLAVTDLTVVYDFGGMKAVRVVPHLYLVSFDKYDLDGKYVVKGVPLVGVHDVPHTFEVLDDTAAPRDDGLDIDFKQGIYLRMIPLAIRANDVVKAPDVTEATGFEIEISDVSVLS